ncbi:cytochrome P450 [Xylariales sp. PMI_506]|nr:cytochrome P450 [Xylariales sp. PMI_506]
MPRNVNDPAVLMGSLGRTATTRYVLTSIAVAASAAALVVDCLYLRPGAPSVQQKGFGILLVVLGIYTQVFLRADHQYYHKMARNGCQPIPSYPNDPTGIRFLLESAKAVTSHRLLQLRVQQIQTFGHTFRHRMFPDLNMSITTDDPENLKTILSTRFDDWVIPPTRIQGFMVVLGYHSIFTTNGAEWQHSRAMLRPAFVRDQISDLKCFDHHISKLINRIPKDGSRFDIQDLFAMYTVDSISDFMLGKTTDLLESSPPRSVKFGKWFDAALVKIAWRSRLGWMTMILPDQELNEYSKFLRSYVDDFVEEKRLQNEKDLKSSDSHKYVFLDELLKSGEPSEVVRNQLLSIFLAGRDTTSSALTYLFYELARRPDIVLRIQQEIQDLGVADPSWEQLRNLAYLNWTVKEALRLNPPVPTNSRSAVRDTILPTGGGPDGKSPIFIPKGTMCRYQPYTMHRRPDIYGDDADEFRPERWETLKVSFEYLPFNAGPRICIGQQFALTQLAIIVFRFLQTFKTIELRDDRPMVQKVAINTTLVNGCWISVTPA